MDIGSIAEKEKYSKKYAERFFEEELEMNGIFKADVEILDRVVTRKGKLLDVAMGPGRHVKYFADKGFQVWGNDFNKHMINAAKKQVKNREVKFLNRDMRSLTGVKDNSFDYVICMGASLGSVYRKIQRQLALNEMSRVAKKNGLVFVHCHNLFEMSGLSDFLNLLNLALRHAINPKKFELGDVVYYHGRVLKKAYIHWFAPWELRSLMRNAGLKIEREFYLKAPNQEKILNNSLLKYFRAGGFIFVGRKT